MVDGCTYDAKTSNSNNTSSSSSGYEGSNGSSSPTLDQGNPRGRSPKRSKRVRDKGCDPKYTTVQSTIVEKPGASCAAYRHPSSQLIFNPDAYLRDFYMDTEAEPAMKVVLTFMPSIAARLPDIGLVSMLDIGSGPTVHLAMCFRKKFRDIYLSDYAQANVESLRAWRAGKSVFDWSAITRFISHIEGTFPSGASRMEAETRARVRGAFRGDIFEPNVLVEGPHVRRQYDMVTSVFCCEAACTTSQQYQTGIGNMLSKLKPGGWFAMGGILQETWYKYDFQRYHMHYLTEEEMMTTLESNGMDLTEGKYFYVIHEGIFVIMCQKFDIPETSTEPPVPKLNATTGATEPPKSSLNATGSKSTPCPTDKQEAPSTQPPHSPPSIHKPVINIPSFQVVSRPYQPTHAKVGGQHRKARRRHRSQHPRALAAAANNKVRLRDQTHCDTARVYL